MKIVAAFKVVPDDQDIQVSADGSLDYSKAKGIVSTYDLNALEAAAQLAAANDGSSVVAMTAGPASIDDSKLKKNVLARGVDELFMAADDAYANMDARATAEALAALVGKVGAFDLILCGDGSADNYAQQVDVQLAAKLGLPVVNGATKIEAQGSSLIVERTLEDVVETVEVPLPAVVSVSPDIALPRIPGMKDILAAGKKPMNVAGAEAAVDGAIDVVSCKAPDQADRKLEILDASADGAIEQFAAALKAAL
ncbi:putative electron transfer flavoprotein FixA [Paraeggerthella hongkongensis]|uniref:putative electron transfer flavoprotein FixA n=1 Tax=Paraeggerthella TaxID=651554 RepID=UPI000DF86806|nr:MULTISPECIES: putative electron transfer flavoprotein FixA [Paraeggerthella]MBU5406243.1 putative electron transfer flavoprotein FixA [Paraeggerthella hongkongensis]MCD2434093.1 putative electron transfer flavoprotein FixA [Paraeggerthella hominis]RDB57894.1 electron transfer flavoprotein [Paraeggerthella hongkongensis]